MTVSDGLHTHTPVSAGGSVTQRQIQSRLEQRLLWLVFKCKAYKQRKSRIYLFRELLLKVLFSVQMAHLSEICISVMLVIAVPKS